MDLRGGMRWARECRNAPREETSEHALALRRIMQDNEAYARRSTLRGHLLNNYRSGEN